MASPSTDITNEEWRPVYCGSPYLVSNLGRVRRVYRTNRAKSSGLRKQSPTSNGYLKVGIYCGGIPSTRTVHRLVLLAFVGSPPDGKPHCNHINGIKTDNRLSNLEWCSLSENIRHADATGLRHCATGEDNSCSKLNEASVRKILDLCNQGVSQSRIAEMFGVSQNNVSHIYLRKTWKHITQGAFNGQ